MRKEFWDGMALFKRLYSQMTEPVCRKYDMPRMELDVILFLSNNPDFDTATDLVEQRKLTKSHVSTAVANLERKGLLERRFEGGNRRTVHLKLLPGAEFIAAEGKQAQDAFAAAVLKGFSEAEVRELEGSALHILANVREALDRTSSQG